MLVHTNRTISVKRLVPSGKKRVFLDIIVGLNVYINQNGEEVLQGIENQPNFLLYKMMTDGQHTTIAMGDRIEDTNGKIYEVRTPASVSDDLTGIHHQYLLVEIVT